MRRLRLTLAAALFPATAFAQDGMELAVRCEDAANAKDWRVAEQDCALALQAPLETSIRLAVLTYLGSARLNLGVTALALQPLQEALKIDPDYTPAEELLAWTYREMGFAAKAEALYTRAIARDDHWRAWLSRCVVRSDLNRLRKAIPDCEQALLRNPDNLDALFFHARALNEIGAHERAYGQAMRGVDQKPKGLNTRLYEEAVWALIRLGREPQAKALKRKALNANPGDEGLRARLDAMID